MDIMVILRPYFFKKILILNFFFFNFWKIKNNEFSIVFAANKFINNSYCFNFTNIFFKKKQNTITYFYYKPLILKLNNSNGTEYLVLNKLPLFFFKFIFYYNLFFNKFYNINSFILFYKIQNYSKTQSSFSKFLYIKKNVFFTLN